MDIDTTLAKAIAEAQKPLADQLGRIERSMRAIACAELARTLYSADELRDLRERLGKLTSADAHAFQAMHKAQEEFSQAESLSWEQRVEKYGMADAKAQRAPVDQAHAARVATLDELTAFEKEHPIVFELMQLATHRAKP